MKYTGKWYQVWFRWIQVKYYILIKRYRIVPNGINFYADMKLGGVGTKGYYWKPMSYTTPLVNMNREFSPAEIQNAYDKWAANNLRGD